MKVLSPSKNLLTGGYTSAHRGYDFDDIPLKPYYASFDGEIKTVINTWNRSWIANTPSDPWYPGPGKPPRALRTDDYGNFLKLVGGGTTQLAAHFPKDGIIVRVGQTVKRGDILGYAPGTDNDTGNSTGGHTHTEYRNSAGVNISVEFTQDYPGGGIMPDMYTMKSGNQVDLANRASNIVLADKFDEVIHQGLYVKKSEAEEQAKQAYDRGFREGQASTPTPGTDPNPDPTRLKLNGVTVQVPRGDQVLNYNYQLKG